MKSAKLVFSISLFLVILTGCTPTISKNAARVAIHSQMSQILENCKRLGTLNVETKSRLFRHSSWDMEQGSNDLRQAAFEKYGADHVVYISGTYTTNFFSRNVIYTQGVAYKCDN